MYVALNPPYVTEESDVNRTNKYCCVVCNELGIDVDKEPDKGGIISDALSSYPLYTFN